MIRAALPSDTPALVALGDATGIFGPNEAQALLRDTLDSLHAGRLGEGHQAWLWAGASDVSPDGWVYFAPQGAADRSWDLWWIGVAPARQGQGIGDALLRFVERLVVIAGGRILVVETSSLPPLAGARRFYANHGYAVRAVAKNHYGDGDDKVTFAKPL